MLRKVKGKLVGVAVAAGVATTNASAAITAPDFSSNVTDLGVILGAMIAFGAVVWGARKLLSLAR